MAAHSPGPWFGPTMGRLGLGVGLIAAGMAHLTFARQAFQAQVPGWLTVNDDLVVLASGAIEIVLGGALLFTPPRLRPVVGVVVAAFLMAVFPGNIAQWRERTDAFGLDSDTKRAVRLLFQPPLVALALWSTGGWRWRWRWRWRRQQ